MTAKKCTKKVCCTCKVVVLLIKPINFLNFNFNIESKEIVIGLIKQDSVMRGAVRQKFNHVLTAKPWLTKLES